MIEPTSRLRDFGRSGDRQAISAKILEARAEKLARGLNGVGEAPANEGRLPVVEFKLDRETYAVALQYTREICPLENVTPLPGTPPFVLGIISRKGRIISILDFHTFFGLERTALSDRRRALVLHCDQPGIPLMFGVAVDAVIGSRMILEHRIQPPPSTLNGPKSHYVKGISPNGTVLLDGEKILKDQDLIIDQDL